MTSTIFEKWVKKLAFQMRKRQRKISLVLENCTAHPNMSGLRTLYSYFCLLTTLLKPSQWMLVLFATLKHIIEITCKATSPRFRRKKPCKINILDSLKLLNQAWNSVSETAIKNCFKKVKFFHTELKTILKKPKVTLMRILKESGKALKHSA